MKSPDSGVGRYPARIEVGDRLCYGGVDCRVVGIVGADDRLALRLRGDDGHSEIALLSAVYQALAAGDAELETAAAPRYRPEARAADEEYVHTGRLDTAALLEALPEDERVRVLELERHFLEVETGYRSGDWWNAEPGEPRPQYDPSQQGITQRLQAKADELGKSKRWMDKRRRCWKDHGTFGLVDQRKAQARNPLDGLDQRIIDAAWEQHDVTEGDASTGTRLRFERRLRQRLDDTYGPGTLKLPPRTTLNRKLDFLFKGRHLYGDATSRHSRSLSPDRTYVPVRATRPGQLVMVDATKLDVLAYDPVRDTNVAVNLALAIDVATRSLLAWGMVPRAQNRADAVLLLADMLRPEVLRPGWADELSYRLLRLPMDMLIEHDARFEAAAARPVIYPETILVDHERVNDSDAFQRGCRRLGINRQSARVVAPTDKPHVEEMFDRVGKQFSEHCAGHKGSNTVRRGKIADSSARWTLEQLEELFAYWVIAFYQRLPHDGLPNPLDSRRRMSPNTAYRRAVERCGWVPAPISDTLYYELLPIEWRVIHRYGVRIDYRTHDDPILRQYDEGEPSPYAPPLTAKGGRSGLVAGERRKGELWPIHVDPRAELDVYFYAYKEDRWYALRWTAAPSVMDQFTDLYFRSMRADMADHGEDNTDERAIADRMMRFQSEIDAPETWTAASRKERAREAQRARAAARDAAAAAPLANADELAEPPWLRQVVDAPHPPSGAEDIDVSEIEPMGSHDSQEER